MVMARHLGLTDTYRAGASKTTRIEMELKQPYRPAHVATPHYRGGGQIIDNQTPLVQRRMQKVILTAGLPVVANHFVEDSVASRARGQDDIDGFSGSQMCSPWT